MPDGYANTNSGGLRPFAPMGADGTLNDLHKPLYNGNIAHTTNTLAPFSGYPNSAVAPGQVLAMVYGYDQLNRLSAARGVAGLEAAATNSWENVDDDVLTNRYRSEYSYDPNGNIESTDRWSADETHYDQMTYRYHMVDIDPTPGEDLRKVRNRLYHVRDAAPDHSLIDIGDYPELLSAITDEDNELGTINTANNYGYDAIGNLIRDTKEGITGIDWTVAGKVKAVHRSGTHGGRNLVFGYGAGGHRIMKEVQDAVGDPQYREHYIRDAQGNVMAIYRHRTWEGDLQLTERPIYGSSRLGSDTYGVELAGEPPYDPMADPIGFVKYELTDHLGNVGAVITDELLGVDVNSNTVHDYFQPHLIAAQGYEPFGGLLPGRHFQLGLQEGPLVVDEDFESAVEAGGMVNGWYPQVSGVLSVDAGATDRLKFESTVVWDGAQLQFATEVGQTYQVSFDLDMGTTAWVGVAVYGDPGHLANLNYTVGGPVQFTFTAATVLSRLKVLKNNEGGVLTEFFIDNVKIAKVASMGYADYRYGFNGQEKDNEVYGSEGTSYTAEFWQYDPRVARRWNIDPVDKPWMSPYHAFSNKPTINVDPNGANDSPIYDKSGELLGTDDQGLQGEAIVMDRKDFTQGMKHDDALKANQGITSLEGPEARSRFLDSYSNLAHRPDYDGHLTLEEANEWFRTGNGQPLFVNAARINLSPLYSDNLPLGERTPVNFASFNNANLETGLVYGTILLTRVTDNDVRIGNDNGLIDTYDFEMQQGRLGRNIATAIGRTVAGEGVGFQIRGYGTSRVRTRPRFTDPGILGPKF